MLFEKMKGHRCQPGSLVVNVSESKIGKEAIETALVTSAIRKSLGRPLQGQTD